MTDNTNIERVEWLDQDNSLSPPRPLHQLNDLINDDDDDDNPYDYDNDNDGWLPIKKPKEEEAELQTQQDGQGFSFSPQSAFLSPCTTPPPATEPMPLSNNVPSKWPLLLEEHTSLLNKKTSMDRRKFNKDVLALLNKTMSALAETATLARANGYDHQQQDSTPQLPPPQPPLPRMDAKELFGEFRNILLNNKEMASEELVERVVAYINQTLSPLLTADERKDELQKKSIAFVQDLSPQMSIKLTPIIKSFIGRQFGAGIDDMLAEVRLPEMSLREKSNMYSRMLDNFLGDSGSVSFALSNRQLLGKISPVDLWFLTFFAFVTARRCRGDNLLMLGCVGTIKTIGFYND